MGILSIGNLKSLSHSNTLHSNTVTHFLQQSHTNSASPIEIMGVSYIQTTHTAMYEEYEIWKDV